MRLIAFPQWNKLTSLLCGMSRQSAADYAQRNIVRIIPKNGIAQLANYAVNLLAVERGTTTIIMPDMVPSKARDFMLRVTASGENELLFTGAEAFVSAEGALEPPDDGETVVYFFTRVLLHRDGVRRDARRPQERRETRKERNHANRLLRLRGDKPVLQAKGAGRAPHETDRRRPLRLFRQWRGTPDPPARQG